MDYDLKGLWEGLWKRLRERYVRAPETPNAYIGRIESVAESVEAENKELEERIEFKKKEREVRERIQRARVRKGDLREVLKGYRVAGYFTWRVVLLAVGVVLFLLLMLSDC